MSQQGQFKSPLQPPQFSPPQREQPPIWYQPSQESPAFQPATVPVPLGGQVSQQVQRTEQASICRRCGKELGFLDRIGLDKQAPRCRACTSQVQQSLQRFRTAFLEATRYSNFTTNEWSFLQQVAAQEHLDLHEALAFIGKDAVALVERVIVQAEANGSNPEEVERYVTFLFRALLIPNEIAQQLLQRLASSRQRQKIRVLEHAVAQAEMQSEFSEELERQIYHLQTMLALPNEVAQPVLQRLAYHKQRTYIQRFQREAAQVEAKGNVTEEEEQFLLQLQRTLSIPHEVAQPILRRVAYLKQLTNIRQGKLPTVHTSVQLESDELCHLETSATYHKVNAKSTTLVSGRLIATNKKLYFLPATQGRGATILWSNIMRVEVRTIPSSHGGVYLELSKGTGNGLYTVSDPTLVGAMLDTLVKISKRQLVATKTDTSRHIPQDVKNAVWQRDGGKCVQCGDTSYLEFDHIIPHT